MKLTQRLERLEALLGPVNELPKLEIVAIDSATGEVIVRSNLGGTPTTRPPDLALAAERDPRGGYRLWLTSGSERCATSTCRRLYALLSPRPSTTTIFPGEIGSSDINI